MAAKPKPRRPAPFTNRGFVLIDCARGIDGGRYIEVLDYAVLDEKNAKRLQRWLARAVAWVEAGS